MTSPQAAGGCPVDHSKYTKPPSSHPPISPNANANASSSKACPVDHSAYLSKTQAAAAAMNAAQSSEQINPRNMMPNLSQEPAAGQKVKLSVERTLSSIPRAEVSEYPNADTNVTPAPAGPSHVSPALSAPAPGAKDDVWEYPSPQQFYNALKRKGWETNEEDVPTMVDIHNFLNEACWQEVMKWEKFHECDCKDPKLLKFQGKPRELSPRARFLSLFSGNKPFDRHDWTIDRCGKPVRYILDYYAGPDEEVSKGFFSPTFYVDVRPALDSPGAAFDRTRKFFGELYDNMFGPVPSSGSSGSSAQEQK